MIISLIQAIDFPSWLKSEIFSIPGTPLALNWYGISYIVGIGLAYYWAIRTVGKQPLWQPSGREVTRGSEAVPTKIMLEDFLFYCFFGILVGGRIGSLILYTPPKTFSDIFKVWEGGMSFHGGFIGVCLAVWFISRKHKISFWRWADMAAIGAALGIFCVRLANFVNQELYGSPTNVPWAVKFPKIEESLQGRHPSQLYEAALEGIAIFLIIWYLTRKKHVLTKPGICAGVFFLCYGIFRIFVEFYRVPDASLFFGLSRGTFYSIPMVIIGALIVNWARKRPPVAPKFFQDPEKNKKKAKAA